MGVPLSIDWDKIPAAEQGTQEQLDGGTTLVTPEPAPAAPQTPAP